MTGALLQLVAIGSEDVYLTGNPQITYFKSIYKRVSNYAIEHIDVHFDGMDNLNFTKPTILKMTVPHYGDLLSNMTLEFDLPDIYSNDYFRWIDSIGVSIINYVKFYISDKLIEELHGEYIDIYHKTTQKDAQLQKYNKMIGNVPELTNPYRHYEDIYPQYTDISSNENGTSNRYYNSIPSIESRKIIVPLPLWFTRYNCLELPLLSLKDTKIKVEIELKSIRDLYMTGILQNINIPANINKNGTLINDISTTYNVNGELIYDISTTTSTINRIKYVKSSNGNINQYLLPTSSKWQLNPKINISYIFLEESERKLMKGHEHNYLIELIKPSEYLGLHSRTNLNIELFSPTKELYIVPTRDDAIDINQYINYTNNDSLYETIYVDVSGSVSNSHDTLDNYIKYIDSWKYRDISDIPVVNMKTVDYFTESIITESELKLDGDIRFNNREYRYLNKLQSFKYHTNQLPKGIVLYNFSIHPENYQPSGACNFTNFRNIKLELKLKQPIRYDNKIAERAGTQIYEDINEYIINNVGQNLDGAKTLAKKLGRGVDVMELTDISEIKRIIEEERGIRVAAAKDSLATRYNIKIFAVTYNILRIKDNICNLLYSS